MPSERRTYGNCSFIVPDGFDVPGDASLLNSRMPGRQHPSPESKTFLSITLSSTIGHADVPDYSESPKDLAPHAFPASITLTLHKYAGFPFVFLRNTEAVLQEHFKDFKIYFCNKDKVGKCTAARSQSSYNNNFEIFRLSYAWRTDSGLAVATLMVAKAGLIKGWKDLRRFVTSIRFE